eukprot:m.347082 g.347082  ORF g.347082 m.347082 type:complete len:232 (+) comp27919_c0_seq4:1891-2586(+)
MPTPKKSAIMRLQKELKALIKEPESLFRVLPVEENILEWHFCLLPPPGTPYSGGQYHGKLILPADYPFRPPSVMMITPSGRFKTDTRLCLSMSDFHPETWSSSWQIRTVVLGLLSFMMEDEMTAGSITTDTSTKRELAQRSILFNAQNKNFKELFSDLVETEAKEDITETADSKSTWMVGKEGILKGLKAEQYNGKKVIIESWDAEAARLQVRLQDDKSLIRVKVDNLICA